MKKMRFITAMTTLALAASMCACSATQSEETTTAAADETTTATTATDADETTTVAPSEATDETDEIVDETDAGAEEVYEELTEAAPAQDNAGSVGGSVEGWFPDAAEQIALIASNKDTWYKEGEYTDYFYALTDLDFDHKFEIISADVEGSGIYTYATIYEVNESNSELTLCTDTLGEGEAYPDFIIDTPMDLYESADGSRHVIIVEDYVRAGASSGATIMTALEMTGTQISVASICGEYVTGDEYTYTEFEGYTDIDQATYAAMPAEYCAGMNHGTIRLHWVAVDGASDPTTALSESYEFYQFQLD